MLDKIKYYSSVGRYMLKLELQAQMEYPSFLIGWFFANVIQVLTGIGVIKAVTLQFNHINGWSFEQITFMYGIGILSHALSIILFIQTWYVGYQVIQGDFDRMLLRPMSVYFQFCVRDLNMIGLTDMLPGIFVLAFGAKSVGFSFTIVNTIILLLVVLGATMIRGGIYTIVGSIGFFTKSNRTLTEVVLTLFEKSIIYPLSIYNWFIQGFLTFFLPIGFIAFYPAADFLGNDTGIRIPGNITIWVLGIGFLFMFFGRRIFKIGLNHYDSVGS